MTLLAPIMLAFAAVLPLVVALYFLKLHRAPKVVSSTYLWRRTLDAYRVNRPFDRFQNRLLLWVQLLILALLILALARPLLDAGVGESDVHIYVVDRSASMSAREEGGKTRLDLAKALLRQTVEGKRRTDRMMIIGFSDRAEVAAPLTQEVAVLLRAIDGLTPTHRPTRLADAWQTALSVARQVDRSDVYVLSDGRFPDLGRLTEANATVHYVPIGTSRDNLGIVDLRVREGDDAGGEREIFARVLSSRDVSCTARVELSIDGQLADAQEARVDAGGSRGVVFRRSAGERGVAELHIVGGDALEEDDRASVSLGAPEPTSVLIVGDDDVFLRDALESDHGVALERIAASGFGPQAGEHDLTVLDGASPASLPRGTYLCLGALPAVDGFGPGAVSGTPVLEGWDRESPLTRHVSFNTLHPAKLVTGPEPAWMRPVLRSDEGPVISAGESDGFRVCLVRFPLLESDWPLRVSFPLFLGNVVRWAREDAAGAERRTRPGEPLVVRAPPGSHAGTLTRPDGRTERVDAGDARRVTIASVEDPGLYRVRWDGRASDAVYAVYLLDPDESDIRVAPSIAMGPATVGSTSTRAMARREAWRWLAGAALVLLLIEWAVYVRRGSAEEPGMGTGTYRPLAAPPP